MKIVDSIKDYIQNLEEQLIYRVIAAILCSIIILIGLALFYYYGTIQTLHQTIISLNEEREEKVSKVLRESHQLKQAKKNVDSMLAKDRDFKIKGYFTNVLTKLNIASLNSTTDISQVDRDNEYRETLLKAQFTDMNMKQLCELLKELEQSERISTKELEITRSKKMSTINVVLTIGTLINLKADVPE